MNSTSLAAPRCDSSRSRTTAQRTCGDRGNPRGRAGVLIGVALGVPGSVPVRCRSQTVFASFKKGIDVYLAAISESDALAVDRADPDCSGVAVPLNLVFALQRLGRLPSSTSAQAGVLRLIDLPFRSRR